ncbi:MAG: hypothetical protein KC431_02800, partial [Myxococcales bacterium]|nr:hypothetical protein [Myxococcales bacterium]
RRFGTAVAEPRRPDALQRSSAMMRDGDGRLALRGPAAELLEGLDGVFRGLARGLEAEAFHSEPTWRAGDLERFGYTEDSAFLCHLGHGGGHGGFHGGSRQDYWQNAVCNNIWRHLAGVRFGAEPRRFTARGTCCRHEGAQRFALEYLQVFTMREVVIAGAPQAVLDFRRQTLDFTVGLAESLGLHGRVELANDPFFLEGGAAPAQMPEPIKFELRLSLYDDRSLACASFNVHGDFFARRLDYLGEDGHEAPIWTSCAAFGLERWVWAVLVQHGPRVQDWPAELRALV